ncbi:MAG: hypothetical protein ACRD2O_03590 [Terriglobia bacterium]
MAVMLSVVIPAQAGIYVQLLRSMWIPASAGMTVREQTNQESLIGVTTPQASDGCSARTLAQAGTPSVARLRGTIKIGLLRWVNLFRIDGWLARSSPSLLLSGSGSAA